SLRMESIMPNDQSDPIIQRLDRLERWHRLWITLAAPFLVVVIVSLILYGLHDNATNMHGTNIDYYQCINKNKGVGLDDETLRKQCLSKYQKWDRIPIDGKAGYERYGKLTTFSGHVKNFSIDLIVTSLVISVTHKKNVDSTGNLIAEELQTDNLWI